MKNIMNPLMVILDLITSNPYTIAITYVVTSFTLYYALLR